MKTLAITTSILGISLLASRTARAQDTSDLDALLGETVSSTASKSAQASTAVPMLSVNVTAEDLRRYGIRTLAEAYDFLALGIIAQDPLGDAEIGSRGTLFTNDAGKHILLLIDGHVTNDQRNGASYHTQAAGLPLELVDHIEIILGPGSVLYGSNAMLGVVNVVTKKAKDYQGLHLVAEGDLSPPQNRAHQPIAPRLTGEYLRDLGKSYRFAVGLGKTFRIFGAPAEITGEIEYYVLKGPQLGWTPIVTGNFNYGPYAPVGVWGGDTSRSYYQQTPSGYVRLATGDFQLTLHGLAGRTSSPYSRIQEVTRDFDDPSSYTDRQYGAVDLSWTRAVLSRLSLLARAYGDASQQYTQVRSSDFFGCLGSQPTGCIHTFHGDSQWAGAELQATVKWLADLSMSSMVGLEGRLRRVAFRNGLSDRTTGVVVDEFGQYEETGTSAAIYAQQIYSPAPFITLNAGGRLDIDDRFGHRVSPRATVAFDVWHGGTAKAIYSEAFRAPTSEELHLTNRYLVLASPNLAPEIVRSAEVLLQQRIGTQRMLVGVFGSWWDNVVFRQHLSQAELSAGQRAGLIDSSTVNVYQFRNVAGVRDYGLNAGYEGTARDGRLSYAANLTMAYARVQTGGETKLMTVTPSIYGNARVAYDLGGARPVVGFASQLSGRRLADSAQDPGVTTTTYAPPMVNFRLTATGHVPRLAHLQYRLAADLALAPTNPFSASAGGSDENKSELIPVRRATVLFGLQYDF